MWYLKIGLILAIVSNIILLYDAYLYDGESLLGHIKQNWTLILFVSFLVLFLWVPVLLFYLYGEYRYIKKRIQKGKNVILLCLISFLMGFSYSFYSKNNLPEASLKSEINKQTNIESSYVILKRKFYWLSPQWYKEIKKISQKYIMDEKFICCLIHSESRGKRKAISCAGAVGLMQVIPKYHYKGKNWRHLFNVKLNLKLGMKYLYWCKKKAKGNLILACVYYNAGMNTNVKRYKNWKYINEIFNNYILVKEMRGV